MTAAFTLVERIFHELESRKGFDHWWDNIDEMIQNEIFNALIAVVEEFGD